MSLGQKTLAIVFLTVAGLMAVLYVAARIVIERSFLGLEQQETRNAVERARNQISDDFAELAATASDYGEWDHTYEFMQNSSPAYLSQEFFDDDTLQSSGINSVVLINSAGKVVFFKAHDLVRKRPLENRGNIAESIAADSWVRQAEHRNGPQTGLFLLNQQTLMLVACPILTSQHQGPPRGVLVLARDLDQARLERLKSMIRSSLTLLPITGHSDSEDVRQTLAAFTASGGETVVQPINSSEVVGSALLLDVHNEPALILRLDAPRVVFQQGLVILHYFLAALCLASLTFGTASLLLLQRTVVARLSRLKAEVSQIALRQHQRTRVGVQGEDELDDLAVAINRMLAALEKSETQFRHIADNIHQVFWIRDARAETVQYVSLAYESLWEKQRDDLYKNPEDWVEAVHPEDRSAVEEMRLQQEGAKRGGAEYRRIRRDGTIRWIYDRYFPVVDDRGHTRQIAGLAEDITEFRQAEQVLRRSQEELERLVEERTAELAAVDKALLREEEHFRQLFAAIPLPVWLCDMTSHNILEVNGAATEIYGYSREEFLQKTLEDIHPAGEVDRLRKELAQLGFAKTFSQGWKHRTKDERLIDVELAFLQVDFALGPAFLVAGHDVSLRLRMEVELRHGQKLQAVGELASSIAHEINTPMQFVCDNVQFLQGAFGDLMGLLEKHEQIYETLRSHCNAQQIRDLEATRKAADLSFLRKEIPPALGQAVEGVTRVTTIVQALRKFSHVEWGPENTIANLNEALESTIVVAGGEFKYVADVSSEI